jgi:hypothetical protein
MEIHYEKRLAKLTYEQQKVFNDKAEYLIERSYVQGKTVEELSKEIYKKQLTKNNYQYKLIIN